MIPYSSENKQQLFAYNAGQDLVILAKNRYNAGHVAYFRRNTVTNYQKSYKILNVTNC